MGIHFPEAKDKMALWCKTLEAAKLEAESQEYLGLILRQKQLWTTWLEDWVLNLSKISICTT